MTKKELIEDLIVLANKCKREEGLGTAYSVLMVLSDSIRYSYHVRLEMACLAVRARYRHYTQIIKL